MEGNNLGGMVLFCSIVALSLVRTRSSVRKHAMLGKLKQEYHAKREAGRVAALRMERHHTWSKAERNGGQKVLMIRHGEALHNVAERKVGEEQWNATESRKEIYLDAPLTTLGVSQAKRLAPEFQRALEEGLRVDAIIVSPMTRAIQTAKHALQPLWGAVPVFAVEMCRERFGNCLSEKRRPVEQLREEFPEVNFDLFMEADQDIWHMERRETLDELRQRAHHFFHWLHQTPWETVVIANHSAFIAASMQTFTGEPYFAQNGELVPVLLLPTH